MSIQDELNARRKVYEADDKDKKKCSKHGIEPDAWRLRCILEGCDVIAYADDQVYGQLATQRRALEALWKVAEDSEKLRQAPNSEAWSDMYNDFLEKHGAYCESDTLDTFIAKLAEVEESWHYKRTCVHCGYVWGGLHCPHESVQNPCVKCGKRPTMEYGECNCEFDYDEEVGDE